MLLLAVSLERSQPGLFEKFKDQGLPTAGSRIYLQTGFPARRVIEFYKSGQAFGDPLREPGPGANPGPTWHARSGSAA